MALRRFTFLREFFLLDGGEAVPEHSSLLRIHSRLPLEVHNKVFGFVLEILDKEGLAKGKRIGVDASTMEANPAMRNIVREYPGALTKRPQSFERNWLSAALNTLWTEVEACAEHGVVEKRTSKNASDSCCGIQSRPAHALPIGQWHFSGDVLDGP